MTTELASAPRQPIRQLAGSTPWLPLLLGLAVLTVPTIVSLARQTWATEAGAHGPIVIATGLWLLYHNGVAPSAAGFGMPWRYAVVPLVGGLAFYTFGRAYDFISLEVAGLYGVFIAVLLRVVGLAQVRQNLFPLLYLGFVIPPPGWLIDSLTAPLQLFVSQAAAGLTFFMGYPVARQGVTLDVAQYQLLVEEACAGMNSLIGLVAVSLFYIYLVRRASWRYALVLMALIIPIAVAVNLLRVVALILVTYYWGDEAAQGFLHATTGMVLFGLGLLFIVGLDTLFWRFRLSPR